MAIRGDLLQKFGYILDLIQYSNIKKALIDGFIEVKDGLILKNN